MERQAQRKKKVTLIRRLELTCQHVKQEKNSGPWGVRKRWVRRLGVQLPAPNKPHETASSYTGETVYLTIFVLADPPMDASARSESSTGVTVRDEFDATDTSKARDARELPQRDIAPDDILYLELCDFFKQIDSDGMTVVVMKAAYHHAKATLAARALLRLHPPLTVAVQSSFPFETTQSLLVEDYWAKQIYETRPSHTAELDKARIEHLVRRCSAYLAPTLSDGMSYADLQLSNLANAIKNQLSQFKSAGHASTPHSVAECTLRVQCLLWKTCALTWATQLLCPLVHYTLLTNNYRLLELNALLPTPQVQSGLFNAFYEESLMYMNSALRTASEAVLDRGFVDSDSDESSWDVDEAGEQPDELLDDEAIPAEVPRGGNRVEAEYASARAFMGALFRLTRDAYLRRRHDVTERKMRETYQRVS